MTTTIALTYITTRGYIRYMQDMELEKWAIWLEKDKRNGKARIYTDTLKTMNPCPS
jgi:hypothetical protein